MDWEFVPLTAAEVAALMEAAEIGIGPASAEFTIYLDYINGALGDTVAPLAQAEYEAVLSVMQQLPPPEVLAKIRARAMSNATDLATNLVQTELRKVHDQLADAVALGKGPRDAARALKAVQGLDSGRAATYRKYMDELETSGLTDAEIEKRGDTFYHSLLRDRREVIAQDEMRRATEQLQRDQAKERGAKWKIWQTVGDGRVSDVCLACEAQGPIPIDDNFTSGNSEPPNHPRCRCAVSYITNSALLPGARDRAAVRAERTTAARESQL